jgi:hypothetical protein
MNDTSVDEKKIVHDIANAFSPVLNYPDRVKKIENDLEYGFGCLKQIQEELARRSGSLSEYLLNDTKGRKILPAFAELCRLGEKNLERFRMETVRLAEQLDRLGGLVSEYGVKKSAGKLKKKEKAWRRYHG